MQPNLSLNKSNLMKKLLIVLFCSSLAVCSQAQGIHLGVKGGANLTKIDGEGYSQGYNLNYHLGAYVQLGLTKGFGIQPELIFAQSTSKTDSGFSSIYTSFGPEYNNHEIKLNYLSIPILANINLSKSLILQLGPQYSILMDSHQSLVQNGKDAFRNGNFSMIGGLWLKLPLGLSLSGRYVIGLSNIQDLPNSQKWNSQAIQLGVGVNL